MVYPGYHKIVGKNLLQSQMKKVLVNLYYIQQRKLGFWQYQKTIARLNNPVKCRKI